MVEQAAKWWASQLFNHPPFHYSTIPLFHYSTGTFFIFRLSMKNSSIRC